MFLAETIWQQQEGTLMSMEGTLQWIAIALWILVALVFVVGLSMEQKLGRANRIARASHDLLKELLELKKKEPPSREAAAGQAQTAVPAMLPLPGDDTPGSTKVYRID